MKQAWGADVPISMPVPPPKRPLVDMGGFAFGVQGICHALTLEERDEYAAPTYAPPPQADGG